MSNVHGLFSNRRESSDSDNEQDNRYVGGIGAQGGGSGLAVQPNPSHAPSSDSDPTASIFSQAEQSSEPAASASENNGEPQQRHTITMYQSGFIVNDGPYRRLNDPANREFLTALAQGRIPRELASENGDGHSHGQVEVGLIDKRQEEYVERPPTFASFSGVGETLGSTTPSDINADGVIVPPSTSSVSDSDMPPASGDHLTSVQIRLISGKRQVVKLSKSAPVQELGDRLNATGMAGSDPYVFVTGFPPKPIQDLSQSIETAGLAGASVQQKKA